MNPSLRIGATALAVIAGASLVWVFRHNPVKAGVAARAVEAASPRRTCAFGAAAFGYDVKSTSTLALQMGEGSQNAEFPLSARLVVAPLSRTSSGQVLAARFEDPKGSGMDVDGLRPPFLLQISDQCEVTGFARHRGAIPQRARQQQALAYEWNTLLSTPNASTIRRSEDGQGAFAQTFSTAAEADERLVVAAHDRQYSAVWAGAMPTRVTFSGRATVDAGPWLESLSVDRTVLNADVAQTLKLEAKRVVVDLATLQDLPRNPEEYVWENLFPHPEVQVVGAESSTVEKERLRSMSAEAAHVQYRELFDSISHIGAAGSFLHQYAEAHPSFAYDILKEVQSGKLDGMQAATAFPALQVTRTREATEALQAMRDSTDTNVLDRMRSTNALASRQDVTADFVQALAKEAKRAGEGSADERFGGEQALLALGLVVSHALSAEVVANAKEALMERARSTQVVAKLMGVFGGIANSGATEFLPQIRKWSLSSDDELRLSAAQTFRRMPVAETAEVQKAWLVAEQNYRVRTALFDIAWKQAYDQQQVADARVVEVALSNIERKPDDFMLRQSVIRVVGEAAKTDPAKAAALGEMYATEPNADLRSLIGSYVDAKFLKARVEP